MTKRGLLEQLEEYGQSDWYPFHMPGHKREPMGFPDPYSIDITEIEGFDNLHHPEGILLEKMEEAAEAYGSDKTWFLVNGSSCGILSAVCGTTERGGTLVMSRGCHKSAYHGVFLNGLKTKYLYPQYVPEFGIQGGILPETVDYVLEGCEDAQAVLIVSPTYEGMVSDIEKIAEKVHERGIPLIVDEAHGAHFPFAYQGGYPRSALEMGADIVIQSLHKTLPSFTQTAVLHMRSGYVDMERVERYLSIYQSSSPSYLFMAGMDRCIRMMRKDRGEKLEKLRERLEILRGRMAVLSKVRIQGSDLIGRYGIYDMDPSKLVLSVRGTGYSGEWLAGRLREQYHLEMEMSSTDYVLAMTSAFDREDGFSRLEQALAELDLEIGQREGAAVSGDLTALPEPKAELAIWQAWGKRTEGVPAEKAEGRISGEFVYVYPPGIPVVAPGEVIDRDVINKIAEYKEKKLAVQGTRDPKAERIECLIGES